jgi:hypothetical protein
MVRFDWQYLARCGHSTRYGAEGFSMSKTIGTMDAFSVLRAAVRKDMASAVIADSVRDIAHKYARQGGSKPLLDSLIVDCKMGASGKARTLTKGSLVACVYASLCFIQENGPKSLARDAKREDRDEIAQSFADGVVSTFAAAIEAGAIDRKAKAELKKAEAAADAVVIASTTETASAEPVADETNWKSLYLAALAENEALKLQLSTLTENKAKKAKKAA